VSKEIKLIDKQIELAEQKEVEEKEQRNREIREDEINHQKDLALIAADGVDERYKAELEALNLKLELYDKESDAYKELIQSKELLDARYNEAKTQTEEEQQTKLNNQVSEFLETNSQLIDGALSTFQQSASLSSEIINTITANQLDQAQQMFTKQQSELDKQLAQGVISQQEYDGKLQNLEQEKERKSIALERKAFKRQKANDLAMAAINTAVSVTKALGSALPPVNFILAAANAALGSVQIGLISSRKFKAASGGIVPGAPSSFDSVDAQLAPGETVINSNSSQMFPGLLNAVNQAGGGKSLTPVNITAQPSSSTAQPSQPVRAYVVESEISKKQKGVNRIEQNTEF